MPRHWLIFSKLLKNILRLKLIGECLYYETHIFFYVVIGQVQTNKKLKIVLRSLKNSHSGHLRFGRSEEAWSNYVASKGSSFSIGLSRKKCITFSGQTIFSSFLLFKDKYLWTVGVRQREENIEWGETEVEIDIKKELENERGHRVKEGRPRRERK